MGDEAIHAGHCTRFRCLYGEDSQCPVVAEPPLPGGRAEAVLAALRGDTKVEYLVRSKTDGWVYALPKKLPKFLDGKRGTEECARWHLRQVGGPDPEDQVGFEIVRRPVGPWEVVG